MKLPAVVFATDKGTGAVIIGAADTLTPLGQIQTNMDGWIVGWMDGWIDGWTDGWMDGLMDGWMDGLMDGWMDGWID